MELVEAQAKILANVRRSRKLAGMIDHLPDSDAKNTLLVQHQQVINNLLVLYPNIPHGKCDYGFTDRCSGCHCDLCPHGGKIDAK